MSNNDGNSYVIGQSEVPAIIFAVLYAGLAGFIAIQYFLNRRDPHAFLYLCAFAVIRMLAFCFRAANDHSPTKTLIILSTVFFAAGFFLLVKCVAHLLRCFCYNVGNHINSLPEDMRYVSFGSYQMSYRVSHYLPFLVGIASGISAGGAGMLASASSQSDVDTANGLRKAGAFLFLAMVVLLWARFAQHVKQLQKAMQDTRFNPIAQTNMVIFYRIMLCAFLPALTLMIIRTIYSITVLFQTTNSHFVGDVGFYCMYVVPEMVAVGLLAVPSLLRDFEVASRDEMPCDVPAHYTTTAVACVV